MKNYSSKTRANSRHNSKYQTVWRVLVGIVVGCVVLYMFGIAVGRLVSVVTVPMYAAKNWFSESSATVPQYFRDRSELLNEMSELRSQLAAYSGKDLSIRQLSKENEELRGLLGAMKDERILAGVTARPPYLPYDALMIDRGTQEGVQEGVVVYSGGDQSIGVVRKVFDHAALVALFSTAGATATVYVLGPDIYTTAYGEGGGVVRISVPQGIVLEEGAVVILPTLETGIVGKISQVVSVTTQPEQYGYVVSDVPIQSLRMVSVGTRIPEKVSFEEAQQLLESWDLEKYRIDVPEEIIMNTETGTGTEERHAEVEEDVNQ